MEATKLSRRQFLGGTAAVAAAAVIPAVAGIAPAVATPVGKFPDATIFPTYNTDGSIKTSPTTAWIPLDPEKLARTAWETYKGRFTAADGQGG